jgi:hypothetical protein
VLDKTSETKKSERVDITADTVKLASRLAAKAVDSSQMLDWFDTRQHYLQLRQRGKSVTWFVRAKGKSTKIGSALNERGGSGYLSVAAAREAATKVYANGRPSPPPPREVLVDDSWTWAILDAQYQKSLTKTRKKGDVIKPASKGTQDDVRLAFLKPPIAKWADTTINALNEDMIIDAIDEIHRVNGHRAAEKCLTYVRAALTFALSKRRRPSGITTRVAWWKTILPPDPEGEEIEAMVERKRALVQAKSDFTVEHLGELLVEHEWYCGVRKAEKKISPGVRWGLWWVCLTGNRRQTPTVLLQKKLMKAGDDPFAQKGWGRAMWTPEQMKGKSEFWLPLPPAVLHVAISSMADWRALVNKSHGQHHTTKWVFASTRRIGRDPENTDVSVNGSSLAHYLNDMRAEGYLTGLPPFWPHLVRSVAGNFLESAPGMSPSASSLMLAHAMPASADEVAPTTRKFYLSSQRMDVKAKAMKAWSDAVMKAYRKAGGKQPMPSENWA